MDIDELEEFIEEIYNINEEVIRHLIEEQLPSLEEGQVYLYTEDRRLSIIDEKKAKKIKSYEGYIAKDEIYTDIDEIFSSGFIKYLGREQSFKNKKNKKARKLGR